MNAGQRVALRLLFVGLAFWLIGLMLANEPAETWVFVFLLNLNVVGLWLARAAVLSQR